MKGGGEDSISDGKFWLVREIMNEAYELVFIRLIFHPNQVDEKQGYNNLD